MEKYYKISEKQLIKFLTVYYKYVALESGGVDDWQWYGETLKNFTTATWEEKREQIKKMFPDIENRKDFDFFTCVEYLAKTFISSGAFDEIK